MSLSFSLADLAQASEQLLRSGLEHPTPLTLVLVFAGGLLTSLGPCSLSLLPVSVAYLAGFGEGPAWQRSAGFCSGVVGALVILGTASAMLGRLYGQTPEGISVAVAILAVLMGLNLLGLLPLRLPSGPDPERWRRFAPAGFGPPAAGLAFGLAASPCTTPVLAVLLAWISQSGKPLVGMVLLSCFGAGQVLPLLLAGSLAASIPKLLALRAVSQWIPPISGAVLVVIGGLSLISRLT